MEGLRFDTLSCASGEFLEKFANGLYSSCEKVRQVVVSLPQR